MVIASISECLIKIHKKIFDKSSKFLVGSDLEDLRSHIEWKQADVVCSGKEGDKEKLSVLSVLSQTNNITERFYSDDSNDTEEDFDGHYNELRQRFLEWYEVTDGSSKMNNLYEYEKKSIT